MGSEMLFDMDFKTQKDRINFQKYLRSKKISNRKLTTYHRQNKYTNYLVYHVGYLGYAEPRQILNTCLKQGIKITFMACLTISDSGSEWEKLIGEYT